MIDFKKCRIVWFVDDNNVFRVYPTVITDPLEQLKTCFGSLIITRGKNIIFLLLESEDKFK